MKEQINIKELTKFIKDYISNSKIIKESGLDNKSFNLVFTDSKIKNIIENSRNTINKDDKLYYKKILGIHLDYMALDKYNNIVIKKKSKIYLFPENMKYVYLADVKSNETIETITKKAVLHELRHYLQIDIINKVNFFNRILDFEKEYPDSINLMDYINQLNFLRDKDSDRFAKTFILENRITNFDYFRDQLNKLIDNIK